MVKKMDELRLTGNWMASQMSRDESDRTGLRVVIELKKDMDGNAILQYLIEKYRLQVTYNFNMIAISGQKTDINVVANAIGRLYRASERSCHT